MNIKWTWMWTSDQFAMCQKPVRCLSPKPFGLSSECWKELACPNHTISTRPQSVRVNTACNRVFSLLLPQTTLEAGAEPSRFSLFSPASALAQADVLRGMASSH